MVAKVDRLTRSVAFLSRLTGVDVSFSNFSVVGTLVGSVSVPGPVAGAGVPGLFFAGISLLAWRRRRSSGG